MRKVYLEPNTEDDWGRVMDVAEEAPVQCWRTAAKDLYPDQTRCHLGCAALVQETIGIPDRNCLRCLAMPGADVFAEIVDAPPREA
jgi:hypothetical protein